MIMTSYARKANLGPPPGMAIILRTRRALKRADERCSRPHCCMPGLGVHEGTPRLASLSPFFFFFFFVSMGFVDVYGSPLRGITKMSTGAGASCVFPINKPLEQGLYYEFSAGRATQPSRDAWPAEYSGTDTAVFSLNATRRDHSMTKTGLPGRN